MTIRELRAALKMVQVRALALKATDAPIDPEYLEGLECNQLRDVGTWLWSLNVDLNNFHKSETDQARRKSLIEALRNTLFLADELASALELIK